MVKSISVPKTPISAYNPKRRVSDLLKAHISNLETVTGQRTGATPKRKPKNEAQASAYIVELTRQLHPELNVSAMAPASPIAGPAPAAAVAAPPTRRRRPARRKKAPVRSATTRQSRRKTGGKKTNKKRKTSRRSSRY